MPAQGGQCPVGHFLCFNELQSPPPAVPPLDLFSRVAVQEAMLSTTFFYPASNAIDASLDTIAVSTQEVGNWLSVEVPSGTAISYVVVYNRIDLAGSWPAQLGTFEAWVGSAAGDTGLSSAVLCGTTTYRNPSGIDSEPYVVNCGGLSSGRFVTVKQIGPARYLAIAEVEVYSSHTRRRLSFLKRRGGPALP